MASMADILVEMISLFRHSPMGAKFLLIVKFKQIFVIIFNHKI